MRKQNDEASVISDPIIAIGLVAVCCFFFGYALGRIDSKK